MRIDVPGRPRPLLVGSFEVGPAGGRVGMTPCPGKTPPYPWGFLWSRDLGADVAAIREWGADVVVTLVEDHELARLGVPTLRDAVEDAGMRWRHAPIPDRHAPGTRFEEAWPALAAELGEALAGGGRVVVHCRAGLGRTGLVAALLAMEFGDTPAAAIARVRGVRWSMIETPAQRRYVERYTPVTSQPPRAPEDAGQ